MMYECPQQYWQIQKQNLHNHCRLWFQQKSKQRLLINNEWAYLYCKQLETRQNVWNNCFQTAHNCDLFGKITDSFSLKGNQSWIFIGRTDAEAPILWPPDAKNGLIGKDPDAGKDWRQEKGTTKDEMVGWHHQLDGPEFEQAPGVGDGQGSLACFGPWGCKEWDTNERLNWKEGKQLRSALKFPMSLGTYNFSKLKYCFLNEGPTNIK